MYAPDVVMYHDPCVDGVTSAAIIYRYYKQENPDHTIEFLPSRHDTKKKLSNFIDKVRGKHVMMVDFSFPRALLIKFSQAAESILIIDHHITAKEDLDDFIIYDEIKPKDFEQITKENKISAYFDMEECASSMCYKAFPISNEPGESDFVDYVRDNDIGKFELSGHENFRAWARAQDYDVKKFALDIGASHFDHHMVSIMEEGSHILKMMQKLVKQLADEETRFGKLEDIHDNIPYCITDYFLSSDYAHYQIKQGFNLAIGFYFTKHGIGASVRSDETIRSDLIAKAFGGGGHKQAAGFNIPWADLPSFVNSLYRNEFYLFGGQDGTE